VPLLPASVRPRCWHRSERTQRQVPSMCRGWQADR
jgi:hypothetical protein